MRFAVDVALILLSMAADIATWAYDKATNYDTKIDRELAAIDADLIRLAEGD